MAAETVLDLGFLEENLFYLDLAQLLQMVFDHLRRL